MNKKPKLAIIVNSFYSFGGGERWAIELSKKMKNDFNITLIHQITINEENISTRIKFDEKHNKTIKFVKIPCYGKRANQFGYKYIFRFPTFVGIYRLVKTIRNSDIVYQVSFNPLMFTFSVLGAKIFNKRLIIGIHNPTFSDIFKRGNTILERFKRAYFKFFLRFADAFHVLNKRDMLLVKRNFNKNAYLIPNPLFEKVIANRISDQSKEFVVLFVGRLAPYDKGIDLLGQIIEMTLEANNDIVFRIIGSGDGDYIIKDLVRRYPNNVKHFGFVDYDKVKINYTESNLLIMPSRIEAFPFVLLEAQSFGLPVVAFDIPGPKDIIKSRKMGELISSFDVKNFVNKIIFYDKLWKNDRKKYFDIKKNISEITNKRYDSNNIVPELKKLIVG